MAGTGLAEEKQRTEPLRTTLKYLECRAYGNPTETVNHLHDKPIDLTVTHTNSLVFIEIVSVATNYVHLDSLGTRARGRLRASQIVIGT